MVTTGGEVATFVAGFGVQQAFVSLVAPTSAYQEQTLDVVVTGVNTHFVAGQTLASFGAGVTVNGVTVQSATQASVNVTVLLGATRSPHADDDHGARVRKRQRALHGAGQGNAGDFVGEPADIVYGIALGAAQLNATANTAGTFSYRPDSGTSGSAG